MAAILTQVGHFYFGEVGQFYIGADNERNEPDVGFVLDVVFDMLEDPLAGLDRVTLDSL